MERKNELQKLTKLVNRYPITALLGPRQCGKTTLARQLATSFTQEIHYFDLEDSTDLAILSQPKLALEHLTGLIIIDEIQRVPELFPQLRVFVDRPSNQQKYLILGSASRDLIKQSSETLAGRISFMELTPFSFSDTHEINQLWHRGGFPLSYLADSEEASYEWRESYIATYLERDIPSLGIRIPTQNLRRFWYMVAHYHANIFNASELGRSLGLNDSTMRRYLDILTETFMVRQLQPWFENLGKRQVKSPKIYLRDSGILHNLWQIETENSLQRFPKVGASWEGFAIEAIIHANQAKPHECFFWATHSGAELDLLLMQQQQRLGFEVKYTATPRLTQSMRTALSDLQLDQLTVIYAGDKTFPLASNVIAMGLEDYLRQLGQ